MTLPSFREYHNEYHSEITFDQFCMVLDEAMSLNEGAFEEFFDTNKSPVLRKFKSAFSRIKKDIVKISRDLGLGILVIINALKQPDIFELLKAFKFSLGQIWKAYDTAGKLMVDGMYDIAHQFVKDNRVATLNDRIDRYEAMLEQHPILKRATGLIVAGILLQGWFMMTFIGHLGFDFDFRKLIKAALLGKFDLKDLFTSERGFTFLTLVYTGTIFSMPWVGKYNILIALVYTAALLSKESYENKETLIKTIKRKVVMKPVRVRPVTLYDDTQ